MKLFGVRISDTCDTIAIRKSASTGNLTEGPSSSSCAAAEPALHDGYASDDLVHTTSNARERKKGVPWTEEEHKLFLLALQKLGKGDWRGISRKFVKTRTPTQVASHAQKYFLRQSNLNKRRRRSSLFDITPDTVSSFAAEEAPTEHPFARPSLTADDILKSTPLPTVGLHVPPAPPSHSYLSIKVPVSTSKCEETDKAPESEGCESMNEMQPPTVIPFDVPFTDFTDLTGFGSALFFYYPWLGGQGFCLPGYQCIESKIVKPIPTVPSASVRSAAQLKVTELSLNATRPLIEPTPLSLELSEMGSRISAFHTMPSVGNLELNPRGSLCNVISVA